MKTKKRFFSTVISFCVLSTAFAQVQPTSESLFQWDGKKVQHTLGVYAELNGQYATVRHEPSGFLGSKLVAVFDRHWGLGVAGKALWHDYDLTSLVSDGAYQFQAGYLGCYLEYLMPVGQNLRFSLSLTSGYGLAKYVYKKEFQADHEWYNRIIDQDVFHVNEPALEVNYRLGGPWWFGVNASYRNIGNLELMAADKCLLSGFSGGISLKYGIF